GAEAGGGSPTGTEPRTGPAGPAGPARDSGQDLHDASHRSRPGLHDASHHRYDEGVRHRSMSDMACPVARSLDVIGEWWSLLIVRDAILGVRRFEDFKATGIADNILSARLKKLVEEGIFERRLSEGRSDRYEYVLTEKGSGLALVIAAL